MINSYQKAFIALGKHLLAAGVFFFKTKCGLFAFEMYEINLKNFFFNNLLVDKRLFLWLKYLKPLLLVHSLSNANATKYCMPHKQINKKKNKVSVLVSV